MQPEKQDWNFNKYGRHKTTNKKSVSSKSSSDNEGRAKSSRTGGVMQSVDKADKKIAYSSDALTSGSASSPNNSRDRKKGGRISREKDKDVDSGMVEKVIRISRVAKVTKGGTKLSFTALVVVGDTKGHAGYALGKAAEVSIAIKKSLISSEKGYGRDSCLWNYNTSSGYWWLVCYSRFIKTRI
jgi:hypothetical protein